MRTLTMNNRFHSDDTIQTDARMLVERLNKARGLDRQRPRVVRRERVMQEMERVDAGSWKEREVSWEAGVMIVAAAAFAGVLVAMLPYVI